MGSLRNPIGPLPSSIYWRRRAVAFALVALLALIAVWAVTSFGGDDGSRNQGKNGDKGNGPASTITPGPTDSGPAVSERPGGRDEENGGTDVSGGSGGSGGSEKDQSSTGGSGWGPGNSSGAGNGDAESEGSGSGGSGRSGGGGAAGVPAPPSLSSCRPGEVKLALRSLKKEYGPGERPQFELKVANEQDGDCRIDLGRTSTIVTINNPEDAKFWASDDCPPTKKPMPRLVPGNGSSTHTLTWYRKASAANCGTPTFEAPKPGTYEVEVKVKGLKKVRTSFKLVK